MVFTGSLAKYGPTYGSRRVLIWLSLVDTGKVGAHWGPAYQSIVSNKDKPEELLLYSLKKDLLSDFVATMLKKTLTPTMPQKLVT